MENNTFIANEQVKEFVSDLQDRLYRISIKLERANAMILNVEHEYFGMNLSYHKKNHCMELIDNYNDGRIHTEIGSDYIWSVLKEIERMQSEFDMNKLISSDREKSL